MADVGHRMTDELLAAIDHLRASPPDGGRVELIVRRPAVDERELLDAADLSVTEGIVGDTWRARGSRHTPDGSAEPERQITIMNARAIALFAGDDRTRWAEAGDQLFIDINLSDASLPAGTHLQLGRVGVGHDPIVADDFALMRTRRTNLSYPCTPVSRARRSR